MAKHHKSHYSNKYRTSDAKKKNLNFFVPQTEEQKIMVSINAYKDLVRSGLNKKGKVLTNKEIDSFLIKIANLEFELTLKQNATGVRT